MFSLSLIKVTLPKVLQSRFLNVTATLTQQKNSEALTQEYREVTKDRTQPVPVETSIEYLKSQAYVQTYGKDPVWVPYRRNFKGLHPPKKTRKTCVRGGQISTGNPCPVCRDEYLVLDEHNTELLKQFISPQTGAIISYKKTGLCQKKHRQLEISIKRAYDKGFITYDVPFRKYDYSEYVPKKE